MTTPASGTRRLPIAAFVRPEPGGDTEAPLGCRTYAGSTAMTLSRTWIKTSSVVMASAKT